ncbi:hypothetical protein BHM03_00013515 [Ensete ventricosum]|nr:hypothetical protein BHM03_00013515 [Ensete ventricosum]
MSPTRYRFPYQSAHKILLLEEGEQKQQSRNFRDEERYPTVKGLEDPSTGKSTTPAAADAGEEDAPSRDRPWRAQSRALRCSSPTPLVGSALSSLSFAGNPASARAESEAKSAVTAQVAISRIAGGLHISLSPTYPTRNSSLFGIAIPRILANEESTRRTRRRRSRREGKGKGIT